MRWLKSWWALFVREYLEHRMPFLYFPIGIFGIFLLSIVSSLFSNRTQLMDNITLPPTLTIFEIGYLVGIGVWLAYLAIALFFYFGDAFNADRRNNGMLFWKSMPVSDLKILWAKFLAGMTLFPFIIYALAILGGIVFLIGVSFAHLTLPAVTPPDPVGAIMSFLHITAFGFVYMMVGLLWYAPFFAWVAGLSAVLGRWSLPLAFVVPGLLIAIENIVFFAYIPRGGYIWGYLSNRLQFGLSSIDYTLLLASPVAFDVRTYVYLLVRDTDWIAVVTGLVFTLVVIWLASQYRRRRIT